MATELNLLCAGAVKGLVEQLQAPFESLGGAHVTGRFGAVGAMKEALLAGEPCDLMIVTQAMVDSLVEEGYLDGASCRPVGRVQTGVAVKAGQPIPDVSTAGGLRAALLAARGIYFPDPVRSTAGIHFDGVLRKLELHALLAPRFHTYPNGAIAMRELAASQGRQQVGCTQVTEINYTEGVCLVGTLPPEFALATVYCAALTRTARQPELASLFIESLAGDESASMRQVAGFEPL